MRNTILLVGVLSAIVPLAGQNKYSGPRPEKADMVYLLHASNLVPTEAGKVKEESRKEAKAYVMDTASSPSKTPLAEPIFLLESKAIAPEKLELYKVQVISGKREIVFPSNPKKAKDGPQPFRLSVTRLEPGLFRLEVSQGNGLENGEYCLSPKDDNPEVGNKVFCFAVY